MLQVARREGSIALEADACHIRVDVLTSIGAVLGLLAIRITGLTILYPLVAIGISLVIVRSGLGVLRMAFGGLIDSSISQEELAQVQGSIRIFAPEVCDYHDVRSRRAGRQRLMDLHLVVPSDLTILKAHDIADRP